MPGVGKHQEPVLTIFGAGASTAMGGIGGIMGFAGTVCVLGKLPYIYICRLHRPSRKSTGSQ